MTQSLSKFLSSTLTIQYLVHTVVECEEVEWNCSKSVHSVDWKLSRIFLESLILCEFGICLPKWMVTVVSYRIRLFQDRPNSISSDFDWWPVRYGDVFCSSVVLFRYFHHSIVARMDIAIRLESSQVGHWMVGEEITELKPIKHIRVPWNSHIWWSSTNDTFVSQRVTYIAEEIMNLENGVINNSSDLFCGRRLSRFWLEI